MKIRKGLVGLLGISSLLLGIGDKSDAGIVKVFNYNSSGVNYGSMLMQNISGATDGIDNNYDGFFLSSPYQDALEVYSIVEGNRLSLDSRPLENGKWDFFLGAKGTVTSNNSLKFKVTDSTNLPNDIFAYDTLNPTVKYNIPKDGSIFTIPLPNLENQTGKYAHWRLDIAPSFNPADVNEDGRVDIFDVAIFQTVYGAKVTDVDPKAKRADITGDGSIDIFDVAILQTQYGYGVEKPANMPGMNYSIDASMNSGIKGVPEPTSLSLGFLAGIGLAGVGIGSYLKRRK